MSNAIHSVLATVFTLAIVMVQTGVNAAPLNQPVAASTPSAAAPVTAEANDTVKVRVLIYSGIPDPEFVIPASKLIPLMKEAKRIVFKSTEKGIIPSVLGYKGVIVENPTRAGGLPERLAIYNGKIETGGKEKIYYADQYRSLEKILIKEAVINKALAEDVYKRIKIGDGEGGKERKGESRAQ